jgi:hypothetical protein
MSIVTFAQIKDVTGLSKIVDESRKITPFLEEAQRELKRILGTTLYGELEAALPNFTGQDDLETLFNDYIKVALSWRTLELSYPRLYSEPTANGVHLVGNAEYSPVSPQVLAMQVNQARSFADNRYGEMLRYLRDNTDLFPSYDDNVDNEERVGKVYRGGVVTKRSRWTYPYGVKDTYDRGDRNQYGECCPDDY